MNQCQPFYFISLILSIPPKGCQEEISTPSKTDQQNVADRPNVVVKKTTLCPKIVRETTLISEEVVRNEN